MKKKMCEVDGCTKTATRKVKNGHCVCEDCMKKLNRNHKKFGHNVFFKEVRVATIGGNVGVFIDVPIKYV